ncbi:reductase [Mannheimia varigena]|uniref:chaperone NapD n=1 Tax=Mannheimia varigena TaxID=85404 RepID=UPI0003E3958A|nr:chaperone NapD [Mannheimia varigena]AHG80474.1 NapD [Mannheimia varigena USDA-ARS-USMARC-1388]AWW33953.1 reductase [Mannheimia varigena]MDY2948232.1 chaperone NapD [Mannheimia varigena]QLB17450.1 reductase [Mannheimia varigena]QLD33820.1 chaperone NapD [Mannheimia varigena]
MSEKLSENENWYVCSLVVQAKPEKLEDVKADILNIPYTEIHGEKPEEGKLVVTIESDVHLALSDRIDQVRDIKGVIVVSLISNYIDEQ